MREKTYDLTQGPILQKLLLIAVPIMGTQFMQMAYNLTDMFWLGRMEEATMAVAASGMAGMFLWLSAAFMMIGRTGAEIGVSQNLGRGDAEAAKLFAQNSVMLALILGAVYGFVMSAFSAPLISLFHIQEIEVASAASDYMAIIGIGIPLTFVSAAITGAFNGSGNSRLTFMANALGLVINMLLDPLMILYFGWGVQGAAVATVIAQGVVCALFIFLSKKHKSRPFERFRIFAKFKEEYVRQIVRWSLPVAMESGLFTLLAMVVTELTASFGQNALAVQRVGGQIESLSWLIGGGFSTAVTAFVGQNYGAGKWPRIREGYRISQKVMIVWGLMVTGLLLFSGRYLFGVFLKDPTILDLGSDYLKILAGCQLMMCVEATCSGAFRGIGKTMPPSLCSIAANALRVPLVYLLSSTPLGLHGIWVGVTISSILRSVAIFTWYTLDARKWPKADEATVS